MLSALAVGVPVGFLLGGAFFGGLWLTVRHAAGVRHPAPWFALSLLGRLGVVLAGFWALGRGAPLRLAAALAGFIAARAVVLRLTAGTGGRPVSHHGGEVHGTQS